MRTWHSNVGLYDMVTGNQIGECWIVEVEAQDEAQARAAILKSAWADVDHRLHDVRVELIDGPMPYEAAS